MYNRACRWLKANCVNAGSSRTGRWISRDLVPAYKKLQAEAKARRRARPKDPRDHRFYELRRKAKKLLTARDRAKLIRYCDAMIAYVSDDQDSVESWVRYRKELTGASAL